MTTSLPLIGRGSEADVYLDLGNHKVIKRFDRLSAEVASGKASSEFAKLTEAHTRLKGRIDVSVPVPIALASDGKGFEMEFIPGTSLLSQFLAGSLAGNERVRLAQAMAQGLMMLNSGERFLQPDCTLDHIYGRDDGSLTFLDFGNGSDELEGIANHNMRGVVAELIGSTIYECSRSSRFTNGVRLVEIGRFIRAILAELQIDFDVDLERKALERAKYRYSKGSLVRKMYYGLASRRVVHHVFSGLRNGGEAWAAANAGLAAAQRRNEMETVADLRGGEAAAPSSIQSGFISNKSPELEALFFVVGDFPEDLSVLNNGIHKAVFGLVEGIARSKKEISDSGFSERTAEGADGSTSETYTAPPSLYILAVGSRNFEQVQDGFTIRYFTSSGKLTKYIQARGKRGLTIFNSFFSPFNTWIGFQIRWSGCPYVVHPHLEFSEQLFAKNRIRKAIFWRFFDRPFLRSAAGIHLLDPRQQARLKDLGITTHVFAAPNGVSEHILNANPSVSWSTSGPVRFLFFGRLHVETKGLDLMMDAVSAVAQDENIEVVVQGPGEEGLGWLKEEIERRGLSKVVFPRPPDYVRNPIDIMAEHDVFLLPSRFEGFPTACVEAMMAARPMVVTEVGGLAPILEKESLGIVVQPAAESIEAGMRRAIASRGHWEVIGPKAKEYARSHFRWQEIGGAVLRELILCHTKALNPSYQQGGVKISNEPLSGGKVLLCAYACSPDRGSEESVGWDTATLLSERGHDVYVLTRNSELQASRDSLSKLDPENRPILIPVDIPWVARLLFAKMGKIGVDWSYFWWLLTARSVVARLHKSHVFTSTQHVTYARYWMPSPLTKLSIPFVWGPVGGGESIPNALRPYFSLQGKLFEWLRDAMRKAGASLPSVRKNAQYSAQALANTFETASEMAQLGARNIQILNSAALSQKDHFLLSNTTSRFNVTTFVSVGRLLEWKGFQWGLEAFAKANLENSQYLIVGSGPFESQLRQKALELGLGTKVEFVGSMPRTELFSLMASSHALVHPSMHESGGYVCLEMMAAGNPVICLNAGGPAHFVDASCGFVANVHSTESVVVDIAAAMQKLASHPSLCDTLGRVGQQRVKTKFSMRAKIDELDRIHRSFLPASSEIKQPRNLSASKLAGGVA